VWSTHFKNLYQGSTKEIVEEAQKPTKNLAGVPYKIVQENVKQTINNLADSKYYKKFQKSVETR